MDNSIFYLNELVKSLMSDIEAYQDELRMHAITIPREKLEEAVKYGFPEDIYSYYMNTYYVKNEAAADGVINYIKKDFIPYLQNVSFHLQEAMNVGKGGGAASSVLSDPASSKKKIERLNENLKLISKPTPKTQSDKESSDFKVLTKAWQHLDELLKKQSGAAFINSIPTTWAEAFNDSVTKINENGKGGIEAVYSDIEHAYNVYKLATSDKAKKYGLNNISDMMPFQMFDIADQIPGFLEKMPKIEFWSTFGRYVPLYTDVEARRSFFSTSHGYVNIALTDEDNIKRLTESDWYKSGLIHHEFGHAQDYLRGWRSSQEFKDVFEEFKREVINDNVEEKLKRLINEHRKEGSYTTELQERLGGLSDSIQAALQAQGIERPVAPRGHSIEYFKDESKQMAEFIAHCSENYWSGNDLFQSLCPKSYEKMREVIKRSLFSNPKS